MHGQVSRGSRDKWIERDAKAMQDSEDSETENTQRYSIIPVQRPFLGNLYQINPPNQPPPPLPYNQSPGYPIGLDTYDDLQDDDSSSSDPSRRTIDRRTAKKERQV